MTERIPLNRVHAAALQAELEREYARPEWRRAYALAIARYRAEGGAIEKVRTITISTRRRGYYVEYPWRTFS